ncbi:MAG TPA: phage terminase large subunit, partial [Ktedonobacteraceae bacterium]
YGPENVAYRVSRQEMILSEHQNAKRFFVNDKLGYQLAVSVGSTTTGEGGSRLLIDDPHSANEAHHEVEREAANTWFRETWSNRMNDASKDTMVVIGQRIHEHDVSGLILAERKDWVHLNLPAEYESARKCFTSIGWSDPRTQEYELLWPERFSRETLDRYKRDLGSIGYAAQYQQTPVPSTGGTFKKEWLRYFTETDDTYILEKMAGPVHVLKSQCWRFSTIDLAISSKQTADFTVIQTYDVTPQNDLLLIDQVRGHFDNPQQQKIIKTLYMQLHPLFFKVESVGYQLALVQQLRDALIQPDDFLVDVANPEMLDQTVKQLGWIQGYVVQDERGNYVQFEGHYVVRVDGDRGFFQYAMEKQGYAKVIRQLNTSDIHAVSIPVREYKPVRDKVSRASVAAIQMENEKVLFGKHAPYLNDLVPELLVFPRGSHDDQVDPLAMACDELVFPTDGGAIPIAMSGGEREHSDPEHRVARGSEVSEQELERQQQISQLLNKLQGMV